jgi:hypothetical protein
MSVKEIMVVIAIILVAIILIAPITYIQVRNIAYDEQHYQYKINGHLTNEYKVEDGLVKFVDDKGYRYAISNTNILIKEQPLK